MIHTILDVAAPGTIFLGLGGAFLIFASILTLLILAFIFIVRKISKHNQTKDQTSDTTVEPDSKTEN